MATSPPNEHPTRINAPLNFRHTDTLITTKVPHYPTKVTTGMSIIPGWNRPNANGQNANINDKDYNGPNFKPRPLKHWRRQLRVYDYKGGANNSRSASISQLDRPGLTVYHFKPDCSCVTGEGGNSYIISNNKFGYETKDDNYSKAGSDIQIQNNGFTQVPYDATDAQINDPANPAYKVLTGVYNTNCVNCSPQGNLIKSGVAFQSQAFYSYSNDKLETRCQTYEQNLSTNKEPGCVYFDAQGIPLWPNNEPNGPQVVAPVNYERLRLYSKPCVSETIYKPNNVAFGRQGAVSGSTRLKKLVSDTVTLNGYSYYSATGAQQANIGKYQGTNFSSNYYVKMRENVNSCIGIVPSKPILETTENDLTSITVSFFVTNSGFCPLLYYILTYYPISITKSIYQTAFAPDSETIPSDTSVIVSDEYNFINMNDNFNTKYTVSPSFLRNVNNVNNAITTIIYPSINNEYTVTGLVDSTIYNMTITAVNGNGKSLASDILITNTLFDPDIQIIIGPPSQYTYTYSTTATKVIVTITSLNITESINCSLINMSSPTNVAVITLVSSTITTIMTNVYDLYLYNSGTFNIYATQAQDSYPFGEYGAGEITSPLFTVIPIKPVINFTTFYSTATYGSPYIFVQATFISPLPQPAEVSITYTTPDTNVATVSGTTVTIVGVGKFRIQATTTQTQNYSEAFVFSPLVIVSKGTLTINFTGLFVTQAAFSGYPAYTITGVTITNQVSTVITGIPIIYTSNNTSVATISGSTTINIVGAGNFTLNALVNSTAYYNGTSAISPNVLIVNSPEMIIYNNPNIFPRVYNVSGEVGLIIGIPSGSWPNGFSNFTGVTITNTGSGGNISLSSGSTPTYNFSLNKYLVFGEPATVGTFITDISTSTASNIAYAGLNTIANGSSSGPYIQFAFTGGTGGAPSTYTFTWNKNLNVSQGIVASVYSSITSSTIPTVSSGGLFYVGWEGYNSGPGSTIPSSTQQAWGISANSATPPNLTYSPLISSGSPPNQTFYAQTNSGTTYYYYRGIPKMIAPNYI
jgi:hypothetical protein